jgi:acetoin utilization deacetylase AcuC-like enzyme
MSNEKITIDDIENKIEKLSLEKNLVGFAFDERMLLHKKQDYTHPEKPERALVIYANLISKGLTEKLIRIESKEIEEEKILKTHTEQHNENVKNLRYKEKPIEIKEKLKQKSQGEKNKEEENEAKNENPNKSTKIILVDKTKERDVLENSFRLCYDTYDNFYTPYAASISAGTLLNCAKAIMENNVNSAFAIIRPPGHHANADECRGFCFYNNIAVTVNYLKENYGLKKIAIVDWDVHHGDGTQEIFYKEKNPLFISLHRFDKGDFYPNVTGKITEQGEDEGKGFNVNIPWNTRGIYSSESGIGDDEYIYAFENIIIPILKEYKPEIILISCGFDACENDPLGQMNLSPLGYSYMTKELKKICGKFLVALEGGYNLNSLSRASEAVIRTLLNEEEENNLNDFNTNKNPSFGNLMIDRYQKNAYSENKIFDFYRNFNLEEFVFSPANYVIKQIYECMEVNLPYWKSLEGYLDKVNKDFLKKNKKLLRKNDENSLNKFYNFIKENSNLYDFKFFENIFDIKEEDLFSIKDKRGRKPKIIQIQENEKGKKEEEENSNTNLKKINSFLRINIGKNSCPENLKEINCKKFVKNTHKNLRTISRLKNFRLEGISSNKDLNVSKLNWNFTDGIYDINENNLEIILQKFFSLNKFNKEFLIKDLEEFVEKLINLFKKDNNNKNNFDFFNVDLIINFSKIKNEESGNCNINNNNDNDNNDIKKNNRFKKINVEKRKYNINLKLNGIKSYSFMENFTKEKEGNFIEGLNSFINLLKETL